MIIFQPNFYASFCLVMQGIITFLLAAEAVKIKEPTNYYEILLPAMNGNDQRKQCKDKSSPKEF